MKPQLIFGMGFHIENNVKIDFDEMKIQLGRINVNIISPICESSVKEKVDDQSKICNQKY